MTSTPAPEVRFTARALRAGLPLPDVAAILGAERATVVKHVRSALRACGREAPPPGTDDAGLLRALQECESSSPPPSTACPEDVVIWTLANGRLDGPLLLAAAEHAGDCADCMELVLRARGAEPPGPAAPARSSLSLALVVVAVVALGFVVLFLL